MAKEIRTFISAAFSHWESLALGGIATICLWAYPVVAEKLEYRDVKEAPMWIIWSGVILGAIVACYRAWRDEHIKSLESEKKLDDLTRPIFSVVVSQMIHGPLQGGGFSTVLFVEVTNTGADSICVGYSLQFISPDGQKLVPNSWVFPTGGMTFTFDDAEIRFPGDECLFRKTGSTPIPKGGRQVGILMFRIDGEIPEWIRDKRLLSPELRCEDAWRNAHVIRPDLTKATSTPRLPHGMKHEYVKR